MNAKQRAGNIELGETAQWQNTAAELEGLLPSVDHAAFLDKLWVAWQMHAEEATDVLRLDIGGDQVAWCRLCQKGFCVLAVAPKGDLHDCDVLRITEFFGKKWPIGWVTKRSLAVKQSRRPVKQAKCAAGDFVVRERQLETRFARVAEVDVTTGLPSALWQCRHDQDKGLAVSCEPIEWQKLERWPDGCLDLWSATPTRFLATYPTFLWLSRKLGVLQSNKEKRDASKEQTAVPDWKHHRAYNRLIAAMMLGGAAGGGGTTFADAAKYAETRVRQMIEAGEL